MGQTDEILIVGRPKVNRSRTRFPVSSFMSQRKERSETYVASVVIGNDEGNKRVMETRRYAEMQLILKLELDTAGGKTEEPHVGADTIVVPEKKQEAGRIPAPR